MKGVVHVWRHPSGVVKYATNPPMRDYLAGSGTAETVSGKVREILERGYELDLNHDPDGNAMPLRWHERRLFE